MVVVCETGYKIVRPTGNQFIMNETDKNNGHEEDNSFKTKFAAITGVLLVAAVLIGGLIVIWMVVKCIIIFI